METIFELVSYEFIIVNQDSGEIMNLNKYGQYVVFTKEYLGKAIDLELWGIEKILQVAKQFIYKTETPTFEIRKKSSAVELWNDLYENATKLYKPTY